jgi:hypothetical protein
MVRDPDATMQLAPQDIQLVSKHRVLSFKPQLRLEWQGQDGQKETEQPDHSASPDLTAFRTCADHIAHRRYGRAMGAGPSIDRRRTDRIILSILNIYRKYYGMKMAAFLFATFYAAMAGAALIVELVFETLGLVPAERNARVVDATITWDYTSWLNIAFLVLAATLVWRFFTTGGLAMLRMMNRPAAMGHSHQHM